MRIAAIITFFEDDAYFPAALASVRAQTRRPDEIIVVDDASPAGLATSLEGLPPDVRVIRHAVNRGVGAARQTGAGATRSDWLAYLDGDDEWCPEKLERQAAFLLRRPELDAVHTGVTAFRRDGSEAHCVRKPDPLGVADALRETHMLPSALLLRHTALDAVGGWDTRRIMTEDRDLAIRLAVAGRHVGFLPEPLTRLRRFDHGNLTSRKWRTMQADLAVVAKHRMLYRETLGLVGTLAVCVGAVAGLSRGTTLTGRCLRKLATVLASRDPPIPPTQPAA